MERYDRNILIDGFGEQGQAKLKSAKVLVVGAGGLGSPVLFYLAAAGVGKLGIMDDDVVEVSNLQRQILHFTDEAGRLKTASASEKLMALNPETEIATYPYRLTRGNAHDFFGGYDFVVDCCDNYDTKFLINDTCVAMAKPYSHGAVLALRGEAMTYVPGHADYRAFFELPPQAGSVPTSAQAGILGSVAGVVGSIQATETVKYLAGLGGLLTDRLLIFNGRDMSFQQLKIRGDSATGD